ncbi:MarR family winged helix-turn-helix transcriptional regulator [Undibacterium flavidum]|uniref:MarR family transcriptional regulator n=1 Tax=Undibacterium flavidum TaxID=2762297 RepID=A0ABR6YCI0_9BURK|nr:MarR family transcriptional regulator [Undibacterium flavidum]MBC3874249.1 MarR family transcriptional regulator [Undibacterium flavidum]
MTSSSQLSSALSKQDFEQIADFRYQLRIFLRFSEEVTQRHGITVLQYLLLLQVKGYPGKEWATIAELAERLQSHHHGVVSLVSRCEKAELILRSAGRSDKRCVEVRLSSKGETLLNQIALLHKDQLSQLQSVLGRVYQTQVTS